MQEAIGTISLLTDDHVILLCAWVQLECDIISPSAVEWDDFLFGQASIEQTSKTHSCENKSEDDDKVLHRSFERKGQKRMKKLK